MGKPRVGVLRYDHESSLMSVRAMYDEIESAVRSRFEMHLAVCRRSDSQSDRRQLLKELCSASDVIVGYGSELLQYRQEEEIKIPLIFHAWGNMAYGAGHIFRLIHQFCGDSLLLSCSSDMALFDMFYTGDGIIPHLIPFGVNTDQFKPDVSQRSLVRRKLAIPDEMLVCLYVGRLMPQKNIHLLLHLLRYVVDQIPVTLVITGSFYPNEEYRDSVADLSYKEYLHDLINRLKLNDYIHFTGDYEHDDLPSLYNAVDLCINLTSHHDENFGLAQVEAMACGVPVVGSRWGGLRDTVRTGLSGVSVPVIVKDNSVLIPWREAARQVVYLLTNSSYRAELGKSARRIAVRDYSANTFSNRFSNIIQETFDRFHSSPWLQPEPSQVLSGVTRPALELLLLRQMIGDQQREGASFESIFTPSLVKTFLSSSARTAYYSVLQQYGFPVEEFPSLQSDAILYLLSEVRPANKVNEVKILDPVNPRVIKLEPLEWELLQLINGDTTVAQIVEGLSEKNFCRVMKCIDHLVSEGIIWSDTL